MTVKGTYAGSPDQFFDMAGLPSADACDNQPDRFGRYVFNPSDIKVIVETAVHGGTYYKGYTFTQANSSGTLAKTTPGAIVLDSGTATADYGAAIQRIEPIITVVDKMKYGMIARYKTTFLPLTQYLIGLAEVLTAFHGSGVIADSLIIGIGHDVTSIASDSDGCFLMASNGAADVQQTNIGTLTTATESWAGFVAEGAKKAEGWLDGVWSSNIARSQLPAAGSVLYPSVDCLSEGTSQPVLTLTHLEYRWERDWTI